MSAFKDMTVLVIDDMKLVRLRLSKLCKSLEFGKVLDASNGAEAWKVVSEQNIVPDIILTDYNMPDMNGMQFLELVRNHDATRATPVIFITAESEKAVILKAVTLGVADFVVKPFSDEVLATKIRSTLKIK